MATVSQIVFRKWGRDIDIAASKPTAWQRYVQTHLAHMRYELGIQNLMLKRVRSDQKEHGREPGYWLDRVNLELYFHIAPYIINVIQSVPHAICGILAACRKPEEDGVDVEEAAAAKGELLMERYRADLRHYK